MCSRHQPLNGADSAEALADYETLGCGCIVDRYQTLITCEEHVEPWARRTHCAACSLPAQPGESYCAGHLRLGEYRVTDETHWAANE